MKKIKNTAAAMVLSALSFGVFAADDASQVGMTHASDVEAGSNIAPGAPSTGQSMNDAFNVHKLVAGEWSWQVIVYAIIPPVFRLDEKQVEYR